MKNIPEFLLQLLGVRKADDELVKIVNSGDQIRILSQTNELNPSFRVHELYSLGANVDEIDTFDSKMGAKARWGNVNTMISSVLDMTLANKKSYGILFGKSDGDLDLIIDNQPVFTKNGDDEMLPENYNDLSTTINSKRKVGMTEVKPLGVFIGRGPNIDNVRNDLITIDEMQDCIKMLGGEIDEFKDYQILIGSRVADNVMVSSWRLQRTNDKYNFVREPGMVTMIDQADTVVYQPSNTNTTTSMPVSMVHKWL